MVVMEPVSDTGETNFSGQGLKLNLKNEIIKN